MTPTELNKSLKQLGVYHDLYCKDGARPEARFKVGDKITEAVITTPEPSFITENHEKLSLKPEEIITKPDERLSLGAPKIETC